MTGSNSGIGLETVIHFARNGFITYASIRNSKNSKFIEKRLNKENLSANIIILDVLNNKSITNAIKKIIRQEGRLDVLVNNAGYALFGTVEDMSMDELQNQFETNFFGMVRVTKAVLPIMRKQGTGTIINISSRSGHTGFPAFAGYSSSKFALEGFSESLRYEVEHFGINVVVVIPGAIRTDILNTSHVAKKALDKKSHYYEMTAKFRKKMQENLRQGMHPEIVAEIITKAAMSSKPHRRHTAGAATKILLYEKRKRTDKQFEQFVKDIFFK